MANLVSNLVNKLSEEIDRIKCKYGHYDKKNVKLSELNISITTVEYTHFKDNLIEYKCLCCNKNCQYKFDENEENHFLLHTNFLTMTIISFFIVILMNIWMIEKNTVKYHYLKMTTFTVT